MIDKFEKIFYSELNRIDLTADIVKQDFEKGIIQGCERLITINKVLELVKEISFRLKEEKKYLTPKTKFLYVEDGSVDVDELSEELFATNPEIKVIVYRQGAHIPVLEVEELQNG